MKKKDFSKLGSSILSSTKKPESLSDFVNDSPEGQTEKSLTTKPQELKKSPDKLIRECVSVYKSDMETIDSLVLKCASEGQKATKADIYRASLKHFASLSTTAIANKVADIRKNKKTHN